MPLNIGVIGLGVGEAHARAGASHQKSVVTYLCDISKERLGQIAAQHPGAATTTDPGAVLCDPAIDVVVIASYDDNHYEQTMIALKNGKHVFVEKPVCIFAHEAKELRNEIERRPGQLFFSNLILRLSARFMRLKELIEQGQLGELYAMEGDYNYGRLSKIIDGWRGQQAFYSIVNGGGVHLIDQMLWLAGERINEVMAYGSNIVTRDTGFRYNDYVSSLLSFRSGLIGKMAANFGCVYPHFHPFRVYGDAGTFINNRGDAELYRSCEQEEKPDLISDSYPGVDKGDLFLNFLDTITGDAKPVVTRDEIFDSMAVCFAIDESVKKGGPVTVEYL